MSAYVYESHDHDRVRVRSCAVNNGLASPAAFTVRAHPVVMAFAALLLLAVAFDISVMLAGML